MKDGEGMEEEILVGGRSVPPSTIASLSCTFCNSIQHYHKVAVPSELMYIVYRYGRISGNIRA